MKTVQELNDSKVPIVRIDSALEQYRDNVIFPQKLVKANELLRNVRLPNRKKQD